MSSALQRVSIAGSAVQLDVAGYSWSWTQLLVVECPQPGLIAHRSRTVTLHLRPSRTSVIEITVEERDLRAAEPAATSEAIVERHLIPVGAAWIADGRCRHLEVRDGASGEMLLTASIGESGDLIFVRSVLPARYGVAPVHADPARGEPVFEVGCIEFT